MDENKKNNNDFKYTIVMDNNYPGINEHRERQAKIAELEAAEANDHREPLDRLYYEYEKKWLRDPNVLDLDDVYPHSYQWRLGGRYDEGKIPVLQEALEKGVRIEDTEAYEKYVDTIRHRKFVPESWD